MTDANPQPQDRTDTSTGVSASVVIPVYNDDVGLARCLRALENQSLPQTQFEVIVVDNGSDRLPLVQMPTNGRILTETVPGSYAARNTGIEQACAPIIAFTDADCVPEPDWLARGIAFLNRHPEVSSIGGRIEVFPRNARRRTSVELYEVVKAFHQDDYVARDHFAATANFFVRSAVLEAVGPFDASLRSGGDVEFGNRLIDQGNKLSFAETVVVRHPARRTMRQHLGKMFRTMAGTRDLAAQRGRPFPFPLSGTVRDLLPPIPSMMRALGYAELGSPIDRLKYAYAILVIHYARAFFRFRLAVGARSPR